MKTDTQLKVQAYLDNELGTGDARKIAQMISSDTETRELFTELKETKEILVRNEPEVKLQETRDFYWSKIRRGIDAAEKTPAAAVRPWWMRFLAPVAGTVALFAVILSVMDRGTGSNPVASLQSASASAAPLHQLEQSSDVSTITFRSDAEGVTVVWLSGIQ